MRAAPSIAAYTALVMLRKGDRMEPLHSFQKALSFLCIDDEISTMNLLSGTCVTVKGRDDLRKIAVQGSVTLQNRMPVE